MIRDPGPGDTRATTPSEESGDAPVAPPVLRVAPPIPAALDAAVGAEDAGPGRSRPEGASDPDGAGEPVVDLRTADRPKVSPASAVPARRATDVPLGGAVPTGAPPVAPDPTSQGDRPSPSSAPTGMASAALRTVAVPIALLVATVAVTTALLLGARGAANDAATSQHSAREQLTTQVALDDLHAAVLATVAAGVGQPVVESEDLARRSTAVRAAVDATGTDGAGGSTDGESTDGGSSAVAYADAVDEAVERTGGDPLELGNELTLLESSFTDASDDVAASAARLDRAAADSAAASDRRALLGVVVAGLGIVLAAVAALGARRRLALQFDRPVAALRTSVRALGTLRPVFDPVVQGTDELVALGTELDVATRAVAERLSTLERRADWGERSRMILEALDLADDEAEAYDVIGEALALVGGDRPGELLLAERGTTRLGSVAASTSAGAPGCPVDATGACVALRRGQVSVFESSESINACPKLRDRAQGPCSAVCVPVTISARPLGVLHLTAAEGTPPTYEVVEHLATVSSQIGHRLGALRTLESSRQEASTDGLTGLPNRRTLEARVAELLEASTPFVMVLADLDKFKRLNDNFGHEVGDKALQLFSGVLRDNVRGNDIVARLGGEEFVLVYPNMSVEISVEAIDRVRQALARTVGASRLPPFTCSFGIAHSSVGSDGDVILRVADAGLLRAKELGGDQAVVADDDLAADVFAEDPSPRGTATTEPDADRPT